MAQQTRDSFDTKGGTKPLLLVTKCKDEEGLANTERDEALIETQSRLLLPRNSGELGIFHTGKFSIVEVLEDTTPVNFSWIESEAFIHNKLL